MNELGLVDVEESVSVLEAISDEASMLLQLIGPALGETLVMVLFSTLVAVIIGFPVGVMLFVTGEGGFMKMPLLNRFCSWLVDVLRSFPFVILMIAILPLTRLIVGTAVGTAATILPLSLAAAPFVARVIETALIEIDPGVITAAKAMGSTNWQIIYKVLVPEVMPSVVSGITLTIINLIGYSAMAGILGGGGLGQLAIAYGYNRFRTDVMVSSVLVIIVLVVMIQFVGTKLSTMLLKRR